MALLQLQDIGKIYVSEGNVAVGIRGVNLSFNKGEFVAITGQSGSGKSTLLNVISGMDTYEEGELFIEGQSTSHYLQPEWEEYREKYISFIFQDYNILESFTVLQNVELALMHIENAKERKKRALELLNRVGLSRHIKQKGSQLSGGQKQRTVIARALAKNSPIILADEPTGNLDSQTSKEIIALLKEVSKDKLLIVVTHNFEDVEAHATRHVRIFDGAVESDHVIERPTAKEETTPSPTPQTKKSEFVREIKNGFSLGKSIFFSKPKLSTFLCLLMTVGALGMFFITSLLGSFITDAFQPNYMFNPIEGRVVVTKDDGSVLSDTELKSLAEDYGAEYYLRNDTLLDDGLIFWRPNPNANTFSYGYDFTVDFLRNYNTSNIEGKLPEKANEGVLYLPISDKVKYPYASTDKIRIDTIDLDIQITGAIYYYDNNLNPKLLLTEEAYDYIATCYCASGRGGYASTNVQIEIPPLEGQLWETLPSYYVYYSLETPKDKLYVCERDNYQSKLQIAKNETANMELHFTSNNTRLIKTFAEADIIAETPEELTNSPRTMHVCVSYHLLKEMMDEVFSSSYRQFSLFFENDAQAKAAAARLNDNGFIAVTSDATYEEFGLDAIAGVLFAVFIFCLWLLTILFIAFFINLCTARAMESFKNEMAIMRSMGIRVNTIKLGIYTRILISLIPAYIAVVITAICIFVSPVANAIFTYLYAWQYAVMFVGLLLLSVQVTRKQIKKLFNQSVKKSLKGGGVA